MSWIPTTPADQAAMLAAIGVESVDALFETIPADLRVRSWNLPEPKSEMAVRATLGQLAA